MSDGTKRFQIFIKACYVRNMQVYLGKRDDNTYIYDGKHENPWKDCSGDVLLKTHYAKTEQDVWKHIQKTYPEADKDIFWINEIA